MGTSGTTGTVIMAGSGETLGSLALAAAGSEAELFYAVATDGGYRFELQHLSPGGAAVGAPVQVAVTAAALSAPPLVSVASDGSSVACCWEDYGLPAQSTSPACVLALKGGGLVRCTSVAVGGATVDALVDGGYTDCGKGPVVAFSGSAAVLAYQVPAANQIALARPYSLDWPFGIYTGFSSTAYAELQVDGGVELLPMDPSGIADSYVYPCNLTGLCSDYALQDIAGTSDAGSFAVASSDSLLGLVIERSDVTALVTDTDAGTAIDAVTVSAAGEQPIGPVGAATCVSGFGYAYAINGGAVMFLETGFDGTPFDGGSTAVATLAANAQSLALVATDGGLLLATGTPSEISVSFVTCP
jgi:hypothetical protein